MDFGHHHCADSLFFRIGRSRNEYEEKFKLE